MSRPLPPEDRPAGPPPEPRPEPLSVRVVEDAVVYPTLRVANRPGQLLMGVFDAAGYVEGTVLDRRAGEQGAPVPRDLYPPAGDAAAPEAIYAGTLYHGHFGHFLLESLARAWYARRRPDLPFVWAGQHDWQGRRLRDWQTEILDVLELTNPTMIVADPTRFARLHVPDVGYRYDDRFHPEHAAFLGRYAGPAQEPGRRLWLSRSALESDVRDLGAAATERWLAEAGWRVVHPEALGVREQLDELCRAETVAGEEGSAFHALVLLADVAGTRFEILRRLGAEHLNMHTVGAARHVDQRFHSVPGELVLRARGRVVSKLSPSSGPVLDLLGVPLLEARVEGADWADPVVEEVLAQLEPARLLDVGAVSSHPVATSRAPVRVAVSRRLDADPRVLARAGVDAYELALEEYAEHLHGDRAPFDVVRLAGHGLRDVMAAFDVSKRLAADDTVWVLGPGNVAARAALLVGMEHPGYVAARALVQRRVVFVVRREPGAPTDEAAVRRLSAAEIKRRLRWLRPTTLRRRHRR